MKLFFKRCVPFFLALGILASIFWYLLIYDREFTRDLLISQARHLDSTGKSDFAARLYDLAYDYTGKDEDVAIELANQYRSDGNYTKAEYTLTNAIAERPSAELYIALCKTYVEQDKLQDAVAMLDSIQDPALKREVDKLRPAAPKPQPEPGFYNEYISVEFPFSSGTLYCTDNREYPSIADTPLTGPMTLSGGETVLYAVNVADNGLVSPLTIVSYTVSGVIEEAVFADPAVEAALREQLGLEADQILMTDRLWEVREFTVPAEAEILTDLRLLPYLEKLTVTQRKLDGLSFLASLPGLKELDLTGNRFPAPELKYVAGLPCLEKLSLAKCGLSTIADLSGSTSLKYLDLSGNTLRNLEPLIPMTTLEELYLQHNAVTKLDALTPLSSLQKLDISYNSVSSIAPLSQCGSLSWLNAGFNHISAIDNIESFPALTHLNLEHNQLTNVDILGECVNLTELDLSNNSIRVVEGFVTLVNLVTLDISSNDIYALPSWPADSQLSVLDASHNNIDTIRYLLRMENLTYVYLDYNRLTSLDPLAECYRLVMVNAYGNEIKDVSKLTARNIIVNYDPTN